MSFLFPPPAHFTSFLVSFSFIYLTELLVLGSADGSSLELIPYSHNAEVLKIDNPVERHKDHVDFQNQQPGLILQCHQTA